MEKIRVALIDSGIDINSSHLYDKSIQSIKIVDENGKFNIKNSFFDSNGHGTAIAGIIFDKCANIDLLSIKIFDEQLSCPFKIFYEALYFAIEKDVQIINLSLGFIKNDHKKELYELCEKAAAKGIYIVSAFHNRQPISYPAAFKNVLGVKSKRINYKYGYMYDCEKNLIIANGAKQRVCSIDNDYKYVYGNSFACANFTGILANLMCKKSTTSWNTIKKELIENSLTKNQYEDIKAQKNKWMSKVLYFPMIKENLDIIKKFDDNDYYKLVGIYEPKAKYSNNYEIYKGSKLFNLNIYNDLKEGLKNSDTLLIGDLNFMPKHEQKKIKRKLIKEAVMLGKNVFCRDAILIEDYTDLYNLAEEKNVIVKSLYL